MPKLSEVGEHANIEVLSPAEVESVEGEVGSFRYGFNLLFIEPVQPIVERL